MKLQHLAVIFAVIFLPIILITSFYINQQVDTIKLQESYDDKLLDATHDAMVAFELNTANEDLSSVADSLRSIIEASNGVFLNTLATNLGVSNASKSLVQPYIPAILYTLYDGYYIYAPTNAPVVCVDKYGQTISTNSYGVTYERTINVNGQAIGIYSFNQDSVTYLNDTTTANGGNKVNLNMMENNGVLSEYGQMLYKNKNGTYSTILHNSNSLSPDYNTFYKQSYILKSFVSYTGTYENDDRTKNVTINYTLDNFLTVNGKIGDIYYTKSGYLIADNLISRITVNGVECQNWYVYSEDNWHQMINDPANYNVQITLNNNNDINYNTLLTNVNVTDDVRQAMIYYIDSWMFSKWIYANLGDVKASNIKNNDYTFVNIEGNKIDTNGDGIPDKSLGVDTELASRMMHNFDGDNELIFNPSENPENAESKFVRHKRDITKNSITYNLALAMVTYTEMSSMTEYNLPILKDSEWDKILSNVSILSFMQGMKCGLKVYNNYALVCSNNNEISVTPSEIYYVPDIPETLADGSIINTNIEDNYPETAHRIDCPDLLDAEHYISFKSKEVKYDKLYSKLSGKYEYDHKVYTDYKCLVDSNYISINGVTRGNTDLFSAVFQTPNKLRAYRIGVAKERNNLYKSIEYEENLGFQIKNYSANLATISGGTGTISISSGKPISEISRLEIVIEDTENRDHRSVC